MTRWSAVTRSALGFSALGAGLIHLALAVGAEPWIATTLITVGACELLWGVLTVSRPGPPMPRIVIVAALAPPVAWILLLAAGLPDGPRPLPTLAATILDLVVAGGLAVTLRRPPARESRHPVVGILIAGALVAAVTVPALVVTDPASRLPTVPAPAHDRPAH